MAVYSARPMSSRPQSRVNPITGEDMPYSDWQTTPRGDVQKQQIPNNNKVQMIQTSRDGSRQANITNKGLQGTSLNMIQGNPRQLASSVKGYQGTSENKNIMTPRQEMTSARNNPRSNFVPPLNLSKIVGKDDDSSYIDALEYTDYPPDSPSSAFSMRTPVSVQRVYLNSQTNQPKLSVGTNTSYRPKQNEIDEKVNELTRRDDDSDVIDDVDVDVMQKGWTQAPYSKAALNKIRDKEEFEDEKKKLRLLETMLTDQLCRPVISDPQQNLPQPSSQPAASYRPGQKRGSVRTLHDTKVRTDGTSTENLLSRRVRFEARVLTTVGRDAIRELTGFFFAVDNSLTVYEFRQFGKALKAMPFIKRGVFCYPHGSRMNEQYSLTDIIQDNVIYFETEGQCLPDSMKEDKLVSLVMTEVDIDAKKSILLSGVAANQKEDMWIRFHMPKNKEEEIAMRLLYQVHSTVRPQIQRRGIKVFSGLGRLYRKESLKSDDGRLNKYELERGLLDFHIEIPQNKVDDLWEVLDHDNTSFLPYYDFMRGFLGEMSETRKSYVRKAFIKIDSGRKGTITLSEMRKFYNANKHPKVRAGECTEDEVLNLFLSSFDNMMKKGEVMYREFEEYYEGLSVGVEKDEDFINILKNAWNI